MMSVLEEKEKLEQETGKVVSQRDWAKAVRLEEKELEQVLEQGKQAKTKMIRGNLRLVVAVAKKYTKRNLEFLDLIQEGSIGLERGVEKFDPTKGYKFSTYAYWWIRQGMTRAIAQQSRTIRIPIHITDKLNKSKYGGYRLIFMTKAHQLILLSDLLFLAPFIFSIVLDDR